MVFGITEIQRVDDHANIGRFFSGLPRVEDLNQFERRIVHDRLELFVSVSVEVGFLADDIFFQQESFQHQLHVEFWEFGFSNAKGDIVKITK